MTSSNSSQINSNNSISSKFKVNVSDNNLKVGNGHGSQSDQEKSYSDSIHSPIPPSGSMSVTSQSSVYPERSSSNQSGTYASTQKLICPVCHISVSTLTDLNKHIDREHMEDLLSEQDSDRDSYSEEDVSELIFNWFRSAHQKVIVPLSKKTPNLQQLQKLAQGNHPDIVFNTHLKENEQNGDNVIANTSTDLKDNNQQADSKISLITTTHFKNPALAIKCYQKRCTKNFGLLTSKINCYSCGEVFCEEHCNLQMRLTQQARPDPGKGLWACVCRRCFISKEVFHDKSPPVSKDHFSTFKSVRTKVVDRRQLEANRLTARLERLARVPGGPAGPAAKTVVAWQPDSEVNHCPLCALVFRPLIRRKHHCRLCGRVVCGESSCVSKVSIDAILKNGPNPQTDILVCIECLSLVNRRQNHSKTPKIVEIYSQLRHYQKTIETNLPIFNDLILTLKPKENIQGNDPNVKKASILRQELLGAFSQFDALRGRLQHISEPPGLRARLITALCTAAVQFLQANTVSLSALPRLLAPKPNSEPISQTIPTIKLDSLVEMAPEIRLKLNAFLEQQINLESQLAEATSHRRLDDVRILTGALQMIREEINLVESELKSKDY